MMVCGEILPYEIFQLFLDTTGLRQIYIFPYPFREGWEKPFYFSFEPTGTAQREIRKYAEKKREEMYQVMREKSESIGSVIPSVDAWQNFQVQPSESCGCFSTEESGNICAFVLLRLSGAGLPENFIDIGPDRI